MADNFFVLSKSYRESVPETDQRLDTAVAPYIDSECRLGWGEAAEVRKALKKEGFSLNKTQLEAAIRRFRIPYLLLNKQGTAAMKRTAKKQHRQAEGWNCLVKDGFKTWAQVEKALSAPKSKPKRSAPVNHDSPLYEGGGVVVLTEKRYNYLLKVEAVTIRLNEITNGL